MHPYSTVEDAHAQALARGANCRECPLWGSERGPVMGQIRPHTKAVMIGEIPSQEEVKQGVPFIGDAGSELSRALRQVNATRSDVSITNVLLCRQPAKMDMDRYLKQCKEAGKKSPIECCEPRLWKDIEESGAQTLVTLGSLAMESTAKHYKIPVGGRKQKPGDLALAAITKQRGHPLPLPDGKVLMPTIHPGYALRTAKHMLQPIRDDIARGMTIAIRGRIDNPEPNYIMRPTLAQVETWCDQAVKIGAHVMVDIETDGLSAEAIVRCIGLGYDIIDPNGQVTETVICIPFVLRNGTSHWSSEEEFQIARRAVERVLNTCRLIFHNGAFDTKVLFHSGWIKDRYMLWDDSMLAHRNSREVECPHKLSFVSARFGEFILWKEDVDHKAVDASQTDDDYWLYNCRDVRSQLVCWRGLKAWMTQDKTWEQYEVDKVLSRIYRDVGELGWYLDEIQRRELSVQINIRVKDLRKRLVDMVGDVYKPKSKCKGKRKKNPEHRCEDCQFNPGSPHQVAWYLFKHVGLIPAVNKKGKKYELDDETTTSTPALLAMIDNGLDEKSFRFLDTLILYRSADKLRSSYIDAMNPDREQPKDGKKKVQLVRSQFEGLSWLRVSWNVAGTDTGRLSSNPNVQNIPARTSLNIKTMFVAPPGHVLVKADFDQIEARIFAWLAQDKTMLKAFREFLDVHSMNAATIYSEIEGKTIEEIYRWLEPSEEDKKAGKGATPEERDLYRTFAKKILYAKQYGAEDGKMFQILTSDRDKATNERTLPLLAKMPRKEAETLVKSLSASWDKTHAEMKIFHKSITAEVAVNGRVVEPVTGRVRCFPDGPNTPNVPLNFPMQSAAAACANKAAIKIDAAIPHKLWSPFSGLICQVHDELVVCVPLERAAEAVQIMKDCMRDKIGDIDITASPEVVRRWSGPICKCGLGKKSHKGKKGCGNYTPKTQYDAEVLLPKAA